ncbi:MAG TPA: glucosamine-6-phosphate deaminase [Thermomicrobiales bacterium]|nr:glucosamine-6-phosphate deaminase [Thermomicrobiales bacterium]
MVADAEAMDARAAELVGRAIADGSAGTVAFPTGSTPINLYRRLSDEVRAGRLDFHGVVVFQLDEFRGLAPDDPQSFAVWLRKQLLDTAGIGDDRFHLVPAQSDDPDADGATFETLIDRSGGLDLAILGLGDNGHVAFNEPGSAADSRTRLLTLTDATIEQTARTWQGEQPVPREAVSMGIATLLEARRLLLLVKGPAKAAVVRRVLIDTPSAETPGSFMRAAADRLTVVLDAEAAGEIAGDLSSWERLGGAG